MFLPNPSLRFSPESDSNFSDSAPFAAIARFTYGRPHRTPLPGSKTGRHGIGRRGWPLFGDRQPAGRHPAVENGKRRLGKCIIIDMRINVMEFDRFRTGGKKTRHEGAETIRVVKVGTRPVPFTATASRKKQRRRPLRTARRSRCASATIRQSASRSTTDVIRRLCAWVG